MSIVYDAGVLVAAERSDRDVWADHRVRLATGLVPTTTAPVVAQVSRSPRQVQLRRILRGCEIRAFMSEEAHGVGTLLGDAGASDVVDAHLVRVAERLGVGVLTADVTDLLTLAAHVPGAVPVHPL